MSIAALFIIARTWNQPRYPSADKWIRKLAYIYTVEYYSAIKKNTFESVLMRWMKLEPIIQSEVNQKDKHQYSILMHIYGICKDGNDNPIYKAEKETLMYRTDFCPDNLKIPSAKQRKKPFSTCSSHMIVISLSYFSCMFM